MDNKRKAPRIPVISMARITPHGLQTSNEALVRDICTHGMGVYVKSPYQKGDALLIKIALQTDEKDLINETLMGRVAWVTPFQGEYKYAAGIEFHEMEKKNPKLYAYIKHLEEIGSHTH